jgi:uroporphyrinogen decarboxylase
MSDIQNSLFLRAAQRRPVPRTPVWFMRQAGRVLPEYRAVRERLTLMQICEDPELCAEVTLQPVRRFGVDAAILFADLMHPLAGVGIDLELVENVGPVIREPIRSLADVSRLRPIEPEQDLPATLETIRILKRELGGETPVVGFAGAPFTLAAYLVEGKPSRDFLRTKAMMYGEPEMWHALMRRLSEIVTAFMQAQIAAGVDALQLFDSWVGALSPRDYEMFVRPHTARILAALRPAGIPLIHFGVNTATLLPQMKDDGGTVIGLDWRIPLDDGWRIVGYDKAVQGNLDPAVLLGPPDAIRDAVSDVLTRAGGRPGHIFNLGHGLHPQTPLDGVYKVVEYVREFAGAGPRGAKRTESAGRAAVSTPHAAPDIA